MTCTHCKSSIKKPAFDKIITQYNRQQNILFKVSLCHECTHNFIVYLLDEMPMTPHNRVIQKYGRKLCGQK